MSVNRGSSHLSNWCLQLTLMLLKVKDTSVMLREGGTPGGSNLGSSSVMVAPRPTGPRSLTVTPIGSSQHLRCCETGVIHHDAESLKTYLWPTSRDLSIGTLASVASPRYYRILPFVFKLPRGRSITPVGLNIHQPLALHQFSDLLGLKAPHTNFHKVRNAQGT